MLTEDQKELLEDMQECLDMIELQIGRIKQKAQETQNTAWPATAYELMDTNGHYLMSPLLIQKAQLLYEISDLEAQDKEDEVQEECETEVKEDVGSTDLSFNRLQTPGYQSHMARYGVRHFSLDQDPWSDWSKANPSPAFDSSRWSDEEIIEKARDGIMSVNRAREIIYSREQFRGSKFDPDAGLQPKQKWLQNRLDAINTAIQVRLGTNLPIPDWWNKERVELLEQISRG